MTEIGRVLVVIPTYNELENLKSIVTRVLAATPANVEILVADDASPDGTGALADALAAQDPRVHVLHRPGKEGLGAAYLAGFAWGREHGFEVLVEMDADGSHQPEQLPLLLAEIAQGADLVIGSRWVPGGAVQNWPKRRILLSQGGNIYTRMALGIPIRDATAGFRAFRASALDRIGVEEVRSQGYCFQVDLTWRAAQEGLRITEVPITFIERERGNSKMSQAIVAEALWRVTVWGAQRHTRRFRSGKPVSTSASPAKSTGKSS